jgi:hypothetical protein
VIRLIHGCFDRLHDFADGNPGVFFDGISNLSRGNLDQIRIDLYIECPTFIGNMHFM